MAAATDNRRYTGDGAQLSRDQVGLAFLGPIAANAILFVGALAGQLLSDLSNTPAIYNFVADGTMRCLGFVTLGADNTGGVLGARPCRVVSETGALVDKNAGGANAMTMANLYAPVYGVDNQTCSLLASDSPGAVIIGMLTGFDRQTGAPMVLVDATEAAGFSTLGGRPLAKGQFVPSANFRGIKNVSGRNGAGGCAAVGAKVGDVVLSMSFAKAPTAAAATQAGLTAFESTISVAGQIQQVGGANLSNEAFDLLLLAQS